MKEDWKKMADGWYSYEYPRAAMTADAVIFGFDGQDLQVLLGIKIILVEVLIPWEKNSRMN